MFRYFLLEFIWAGNIASAHTSRFAAANLVSKPKWAFSVCRYNEWTKELLNELLELCVMVYCCALFRLRDFTDYNNVSINTPYHENVVLLTPYRNIVYISCEGEGLEGPGQGPAKL